MNFELINTFLHIIIDFIILLIFVCFLNAYYSKEREKQKKNITNYIISVDMSLVSVTVDAIQTCFGKIVQTRVYLVILHVKQPTVSFY